MRKLRLSEKTAEIRTENGTFYLPLNEDTLEELRDRAERLQSLIDGGDREEIRDAAIETVDDILGEGSFETIAGDCESADMFDAMEVFSFICDCYAEAWHRRIIGLRRRNGL